MSLVLLNVEGEF